MNAVYRRCSEMARGTGRAQAALAAREYVHIRGSFPRSGMETKNAQAHQSIGDRREHTVADFHHPKPCGPGVRRSDCPAAGGERRGTEHRVGCGARRRFLGLLPSDLQPSRRIGLGLACLGKFVDRSHMALPGDRPVPHLSDRELCEHLSTGPRAHLFPSTTKSMSTPSAAGSTGEDPQPFSRASRGRIGAAPDSNVRRHGEHRVELIEVVA